MPSFSAVLYYNLNIHFEGPGDIFYLTEIGLPKKHLIKRLMMCMPGIFLKYLPLTPLITAKIPMMCKNSNHIQIHMYIYYIDPRKIPGSLVQGYSRKTKKYIILMYYTFCNLPWTPWTLKNPLDPPITRALTSLWRS